MSVCYDEGSAWCGSYIDGLLIKIGSTGSDICYNEFNVDNIKCIAADNDGGCYYINNTILYKVDIYGSIVKTDDIKIAYRRVIRDNDILWFVYNNYIVKFYTDTYRFDKPMYIQNIINAHITDNGIMAWCSDNYMRYVNKSTGLVGYEVNYGLNKTAGVMDLSFSNDYFSYLFPAEYDDYWNSLEWIEVDMNDIVIADNEFYQIKLYFKGTDENSPFLNDIRFKDNLIIHSIPSHSSKPVYLRCYTDDVKKSGIYNTYMNVRWRIYD
jgi:hypothetical protein